MGKENMSQIEIIRHSLSHVLAAAVLNLYPDTKLGIGPAIDNGFYYDFEFSKPLTPEALPKIEKQMRKILTQKFEFEKSEMDVKKAEVSLKGQPYKVELVKDLAKDGEKKVSFYSSGEFTDLCAGPHVKSSADLRKVGFKLDKLAGAYWKGTEANKMLTRIYALAFETQKELDDYLVMLAEAEKRDHRKLGQALDLFSFHEEGPGFPFWHQKGMVLRNELMSYWREEHQKAGYQEVSTPIILREELWHQSGHWDNYRNNMYFTEIDEQGYALKPMNCPGGILIYKSELHSYRELPIRAAELGLVHRHELSGVLHGLFRVRAFTQDDAHIYCTEEQIKDELEGVIKLIERVYTKFGFSDYHVELSTRPEKSIGTDAMWGKAEKTMLSVAKDMKLKYQVNPGDGAFYGPKFDFHIKDSIGRTWQCGTIQLDFSMPERFDMTYIDAKGEKKRPVMIHRTVLGSIERFMGVLIEHTAGALPVWLAPVQVAVINVGESAEKYAAEVANQLTEAGVRVDLMNENESVGKKIRGAEMQKVPYMLVIGDKEVAAKSVAVRTLSNRDIESVKLDKFISNLLIDIEERK
jgi:threonyl-tRNA synthetase